MPEYVIETSQVVKRKIDYPLELPVDMGDQTLRLCDHMIKQLANKKQLAVELSESEGSIVYTSEEKITAIYRDDQQIWPRPRRIRTKHIQEEPDAPEPDDDVEDATTTDLF